MGSRQRWRGGGREGKGEDCGEEQEKALARAHGRTDRRRGTQAGWGVVPVARGVEGGRGAQGGEWGGAGGMGAAGVRVAGRQGLLLPRAMTKRCAVYLTRIPPVFDHLFCGPAEPSGPATGPSGPPAPAPLPARPEPRAALPCGPLAARSRCARGPAAGGAEVCTRRRATPAARSQLVVPAGPTAGGAASCRTRSEGALAPALPPPFDHSQCALTSDQWHGLTSMFDQLGP